MNIITKYILLFDCVNSSFSDRCVRRRKELRKRRGCARFPFLSFFPPHISLSLSFSFFNRDEEDDERSSLSKSLCYRFPSGCATVCLPCTPSSRCLPPSRCILQRIRSFRRVRFFNSSRGGEKKGVGGKKKKEEGTGATVGRMVGRRNADSFSIPRVSMRTREYKCRKLRILCDRSIAPRIVPCPLFDRSWTLENFDLGFTLCVFLYLYPLTRVRFLFFSTLLDALKFYQLPI